MISYSAKDQVTKKDSKCLILRLKVFAHVMCHANQDKVLPFIGLISQCHSVLSVNEPILFSKESKDGQSTVDALRQLNRMVVINLVYDPDRKNIDRDRLKHAESPGLSGDTPMKLADNEGMVEDDLIEEPVLDRKAKSSMPFSNIGAAPKEEKSMIYYRRHKLFSELAQVPLQIMQRDNVWLLEEFLLKRFKTIEDVRKLEAHTRRAYSSGLFKQAPDQMLQAAKENFEELERYELQETFAKCIEKVDYIVSNAQDSEEFHLMMPENLREMSDTIVDHHKQFGYTDKELELLFKHIARDTEEIIREHELGQASGEEDQDILERDANELAYYI